MDYVITCILCYMLLCYYITLIVCVSASVCAIVNISHINDMEWFLLKPLGIERMVISFDLGLHENHSDSLYGHRGTPHIQR